MAYNPTGNVIFCDSFSHYAAADTTRKWTSAGANVSIVPGRNLKGMRVGTFASISLTLPQDYSNLCAGVAYNTPAFANPILAYGQSSGHPQGANASLTHVGNGRLQVFVQLWGGSVTAPVRNFVMHANVWYYAEFKVAIAARSVTWEVRINEGVVDGGVITVPNGYPDFNLASLCEIGIVGPGGGYAATVTDFYASDGDYFGDIAFKVIYPSGDRSIGGWQQYPLDGRPFCTKVNEHTPDYDATYISSANVGDSSVFHMDDIGNVGDIAAIQLLNLCKKTDAGTAIAQPKYIVPPNAPYQGAPMYPSGLDCYYIREVLTRNPWTGQPWTWQDIDALQVEIDRIG